MGQLVGAAADDPLLADMNEDFEALGRDPNARTAYDEELRAWDVTLLGRSGRGAVSDEIAPARQGEVWSPRWIRSRGGSGRGGAGS